MGLTLLAFIVIIFLYSAIRANYLEYIFESPWLKEAGESEIIYLSKYPDDININSSDSNGFSFYRIHILPDLPKLQYLDIFNLLLSLTDSILHIPGKYNLCFEHVPHLLKLTERRSCEWFKCGGYIVALNTWDYSPDSWKGIDGKNLKEALNSFPKDKIITKAKVTKDKSCENYSEVRGLHEYNVRYFESKINYKK